jgi:hypothetical protein
MLHKKAELTALTILRLEVAEVKTKIDAGLETIHIVWGDRGIGKSNAGRIVAKEFPYAYYVPLQELEEHYSVSAFYRLMVEATGSEACWSAKANLEELKKLEKPVFILDDAEELVYSPRKRGKTPILLRKVKYLTELGFGFVFLGNEDVYPKVALYPEVKRRVRKKVEVPSLTPQDIAAFAKAYGITIPEGDIQQIYEYASKKGLVAIQLDDLFSTAWFNAFEVLTFKDFKSLAQNLFHTRNLATA